MPCFKCGSTHIRVSKVVHKRLAPGSPTRGKKMKWEMFTAKKIQCEDCQSGELTNANCTPCK